jgi:hypothetical protein
MVLEIDDHGAGFSNLAALSYRMPPHPSFRIAAKRQIRIRSAPE